MATQQLHLDLQAERARLSAQCSRILGRLQYGRVTNRELSEIALKYTNRVSEIRRAGHDVRLVSRDYATGLTYYALFVDGVEWTR